MVKPVPSLAERARGMLLGHAVGSGVGSGVGNALGLRESVTRHTADSPWDGAVALSVILGEELLTSPVDLRHIASRWAARARADGRGIGETTRASLAWFEEHGVPPEAGRGGGTNGALSRILPVAIATLGSPRNLVSGTYHIAALTHPDPAAAWSAVALAVAAARLLTGHRDFVPEVLEVLRANEAPAPVVDAVRRVPLERRDALPLDAGSAGRAAPTLEIALWLAYHEPNFERGVVWAAGAGGDADTNAGAAAGLMGARDGDQAVPEQWITQLADPERLRRLADALVAPHIGSAAPSHLSSQGRQ